MDYEIKNVKSIKALLERDGYVVLTKNQILILKHSIIPGKELVKDMECKVYKDITITKKDFGIPVVLDEDQENDYEIVVPLVAFLK
jgi:hypothetical protein